MKFWYSEWHACIYSRYYKQGIPDSGIELPSLVIEKRMHLLYVCASNHSIKP
ncbi:MAG: hypothetical protein ACK4E0_10210 [Chitinophagaceae bacterium]